MKLSEYFADRKIYFLFQAACMTGCSAFLYLCRMEGNQILILLVIWIVLAVLWSMYDYMRKYRYFRKIYDLLDKLDKPYLIAELMPEPYRLEDRMYADILRKSEKSVIDTVHHMERQQQEYREFTEIWIHEVKVPLTALYLLCDGKDEKSKQIRIQLARLENNVEKALFYARSDTVAQDYLITPVKPADLIRNVIQKNRLWMCRCNITITLDGLEYIIYTDKKWTEFILNQILINAVKYRRLDGGKISVSARKKERSVVLTVWDNGIGISQADLPRVFDKGFTGQNGRVNGTATGMGLYLCSKLCHKMGIGISIESEENRYTAVHLTFPDGSEHFLRNISES